jgi:hypothetical protein
MIKPPMIPKKIGARYHAFVFDLSSDINIILFAM